MAGTVKPRIKILQGGRAWECSSETFFGQAFSGFGTNPKEAFESWERCKAAPMKGAFSWVMEMDGTKEKEWLRMMHTKPLDRPHSCPRM